MARRVLHLLDTTYPEVLHSSTEPFSWDFRFKSIFGAKDFKRIHDCEICIKSRINDHNFAIYSEILTIVSYNMNRINQKRILFCFRNRIIFSIITLNKYEICNTYIGTVLVTSVLTRPSLWYEIGVLWVDIINIKRHATAVGFWIITNMNLIFQMRYYMSL